MKTSSALLVNVCVPFEFNGFTCDVDVQISTSLYPDMVEFEPLDYLNCRFAGKAADYRAVRDSFRAMISLNLDDLIDDYVAETMTVPLMQRIVADSIRDMASKLSK